MPRYRDRTIRHRKVQIVHLRGLEVCRNMNTRGDRPLGTVWTWDVEAGRPQLAWAFPALKSSAGS